jgi:phage terminase small subunit
MAKEKYQVHRPALTSVGSALGVQPAARGELA